MPTLLPNNRRPRPAPGFTYLEILIAIGVLALCLVPALEALRAGTTLLGEQELSSIGQQALLAKTEEVLRENFSSLDTAAAVAGNITTPTTYSDLFTTSDGRELARNVYIAAMDGDNADHDGNIFTGTDPGILYLKVTLGDSPLFYETITTRP